MNRNEALKAMIDGKKIRHSSYHGKEYVYFKNARHGFRYVSKYNVDSNVVGGLDNIEGYSVCYPPKTIEINGKTIELSESSFQALKKSLID